MFLVQSSLIFRRIEAVIHRKILQDLITGLTGYGTAIAQHILNGPPHHLGHRMRPHDFSAQLTGYFDDEFTAVHHILRTLQQLKNGGVIFCYNSNQLWPYLADTIFNINDVLIKDNLL